MVKIKKKLFKVKKNDDANNYQIKTRIRDKKSTSMIREIRNLGEWQNFKSVHSNSAINKQKLYKKIKKKYKKVKNFLSYKKNKKLSKLALNNENISSIQNNISTNSRKDNSKNCQKNKLNKKNESRRIITDIHEFLYQNKKYFELKEVFTFIKEILGIDLDSKNIKIKKRDEFKAEMNDMLNKFVVIYYSKIFINEENLEKLLKYLSAFISLNPQEIIKKLKEKCTQQIIEENIVLEQYFKPKLFLEER